MPLSMICLFAALRDKNVPKVRRVLGPVGRDLPFDINTCYEPKERVLTEFHLADYDGMTPLMIACLNQCNECARLLLDRGADVNVQHQRYGYTALHLACKSTERNSEVLISLLLSRSPNIELMDVHSQTPLHLYALCKYGKNIDTLNDLIPENSGAALGSKTDQGNTVLALLCDSADNDFFNRSCRFLLRKGARVTDMNWRSETILHKVAQRFDCDNELEDLIFEKYVQGHGKIDALDQTGWSPLHHAVYHGKWHLVELLLKGGADPLLDPFHRSNGRSHVFPETERTRKSVVDRDSDKFLYEKCSSIQLVLGTESISRYFELALRYYNPSKIFDTKIQKLSQNLMVAVGNRMVNTRDMRERIKSLEDDNADLRRQNEALLSKYKALEEAVAGDRDRKCSPTVSTAVGPIMVRGVRKRPAEPNDTTCHDSVSKSKKVARVMVSPHGTCAARRSKTSIP